MTRRAPLLAVLVVSLTVQLVSAQQPPQITPRPNPLMAKQELLGLTGNKNAEPSKDVQVLWLYGPEDHGGGAHDYIRSKFDHSYPLFLNTEHPAFVGLPKSIRFNDESYWNLLTRDKVEAIGALAPQSLESKVSFAEVLKAEDARSHAFWTFQSGKGRVFGTTMGHYTYTYYDPMYRLLLMRGLAWTLNEDPAPFMPLVFHGITNDKGLVGTTDNMLDYKNRKR
jgi:hypothetical protein